MATVAVVVLIVVAAGALLFFKVPVGTEPSGTVGQSGTGSMVAIVHDNLSVGFGSGLWTLTLKNTGSVGLTQVTAILSTPVETKVCTGPVSGGLGFANCPATSIDPIISGATITSYATGAGPGSARAGDLYEVMISLTFADGSSSMVMDSVKAVGA